MWAWTENDKIEALEFLKLPMIVNFTYEAPEKPAGTFNFFEHLLPDLNRKILHYLSLYEISCLCRCSNKLREVCYDEIFWNQLIVKEFERTVPIGHCRKAFKGITLKRKIPRKKRVIGSSMDASEIFNHYKYRAEFKKFFEQVSPEYSDNLRKLTDRLLRYYDEGWMTMISAGSELGSIAQCIMIQKGEGFDCPDDICPCFSCGPQSPTLEIANNFTRLVHSFKRHREDFLRDCKRTYYVDLATFRARPLSEFLARP